MKLHRLPYWTDGRKKLSDKFYGIFMDFAGIKRRLPLVKGARASETLARTVDRLNACRASNDTLTPEMVRAAESMPGPIRNRLAKWGILSGSRLAASRGLAEHVMEWKAAMLAGGRTKQHAELSANRVTRIIDGCRFTFLSELNALKVERFLAGLRDTPGGIGIASSNHYLTAAKGFCRWAWRDGRISDNPLVHLSALNARVDRRHDRRALSADELGTLLDVTEHGYSTPGPDGKPVKVGPVERFGMIGADRALLYRLAVESGLRAAELRSLTRGSFTLDGDDPSVTIAAGYAKNRRADTLPLRPETAALLTAHLSGKMPAVAAFNMPAKQHVAKMFRTDLADARTAWLSAYQTQRERDDAEKSTFLAYADDAERVADFHGLRHTFISNLAAGGVHPKVAQRLARHSTIALTMDRYTHLHVGDLSAALNALPRFAPARQNVATAGN